MLDVNRRCFERGSNVRLDATPSSIVSEAPTSATHPLLSSSFTE
jgi:hypothetical protein